MATFILVHGTYAKSAHWPNLQNSLAETARAAGDEPLFEQLPWTGRNRATARQAAASAIFTLVQRIRRASVNEKIFIIGHSHGGNAIAYFLKEHPEAAKTLAGCAFLSTPFVAIRPRKEAYQLDRLLIFLPYLACVSLLLKIIIPSFDTDLATIMERAQAHFISIFVLCVALIILLAVLRFLKRASEPQKVEQSVRQQTVDIPAGNYLFLRCSGDEAAAALSAAQFIAWLGIKAAKILQLLTRSFYPLLAAKGFSIGPIVLLAVLFSAGDGLYYVLPDICKFGVFGYFSSPDGPFLGKLLNFVHKPIIWQIFESFFFFGFFFSVVVTFLLLPCISVALLIFLIQALTSWAFGWTLLSTGLLVELAIEPLPFGVHSLVNIDWAARSIGLDGIVHSWTHAHPVAIKHLQSWVEASLGKLPMSVTEPTTT
jgi:pimeloyl-ACP methyl ester carboxylesterase